MTLRFHLHTTDLPRLRARWRSMRRSGQAPIRASHSALKDVLRAHTRHNFDTESDYGRPWAPLAPLTLILKRGPQKLIETGDMFFGLMEAPFAARSPLGAHRLIDQLSDTRLTWGSPLDYAIDHQVGNPQERIPARPFMPRARAVAHPIASAIAERMVYV